MEKSDSEARILQAAEEEFMEKGLAGARTTSIAQRAGMTHAMLHYYFRTKEQLFYRVLEEKVSLLTRTMLEVIGCETEAECKKTEGTDAKPEATDAKPEGICAKPDGICGDLEAICSSPEAPIFKKVRRIVERHFDFIVAHPHFVGFLLREVAPYPDRVAVFGGKISELTRRLMPDMERELSEAVRSGVMAEIDLPDLLIDILSLNAFPVAAIGVMQNVLHISRDALLSSRREENVRVILKRLKP